MIQGEYYLHENGELIYKPHGGVERDSDFVIRVWSVPEITSSPRSFCHWLRKAFLLGAKKSRVIELGEKNKLDKYIPDWKEIVGVL